MKGFMKLFIAIQMAIAIIAKLFAAISANAAVDYGCDESVGLKAVEYDAPIGDSETKIYLSTAYTDRFLINFKNNDCIGESLNFNNWDFSQYNGTDFKFLTQNTTNITADTYFHFENCKFYIISGFGNNEKFHVTWENCTFQFPYAKRAGFSNLAGNLFINCDIALNIADAEALGIKAKNCQFLDGVASFNDDEVPTPEITPELTPEITPEPTVTPSPSPSPLPEVTPTAIPTAEPSPSTTPSPVVPPAASPTAAPSATPTAVPTAAPTITPPVPTSSVTPGADLVVSADELKKQPLYASRYEYAILERIDNMILIMIVNTLISVIAIFIGLRLKK